MNKLGLAQVLVTLAVSTVLGTLPACYGDTPEAPQGEVSEAVRSSDSAIVGKWQFVYDGARRADIEAKIDADVKDPAARAKAKADAEHEASQSVIQFTEDGEYLSWVLGELIFQASFKASESKDGVRLTMKAGDKEKTTTVSLHGADEIVMNDPQKGPLTFRRVK